MNQMNLLVELCCTQQKHLAEKPGHDLKIYEINELESALLINCKKQKFVIGFIYKQSSTN